jgi:hypothetical protein
LKELKDFEQIARRKQKGLADVEKLRKRKIVARKENIYR